MDNNVIPMKPSSAEQVIEAVRAEMALRGMTQTRVAREIGVSGTSLNQLLMGTYGADPRRLLGKLEQWLGAVRARAELPSMPEVSAWIATPTAERVITALAYAQQAGDIALVYGRAGVGKTSAAREYQRRYPNVWVATMHPGSASVMAALSEVAFAVGLGVQDSGSARTFRELAKHIQGTRGLVVVDEAQHLGIAALDTIRSLHDATGVGVALSGNETLYARMTGGVRAAFLDRLHSRVGKRLALGAATRADVKRLAAEYAVVDAGSLQLLYIIGAQAGALRAITKCLRIARMMAAGKEEKLGGDHIQASWMDLTGEDLRGVA